MTKKIIAKAFCFALTAVLTLASFAFAQISSMPGVPSDTPFLVHLAMNADHQAALARIIDELKKDKDFESYLADFKKRTGTDFPEKMLEVVKKLNSFTLAAFLNIADFKRPPDVLLSAGFADEGAAKEFNALFKEIMISASKANSKEMAFADKTEGGLAVSVPSFKGADKDGVFKSFEPRVIQYKNYGGLFIYQKYDTVRTEKIFKSVAEAFNAGTAVFSHKQLKADFDRIASGANLFFYFDGSVYKQGAIENGHKAESEYVSSIALASAINGDLSGVSNKWIVNLNDVKDKAEAEKSNFIKALISGEKDGGHISQVLPADTAAFFDIKLNISDKTLKLAKPMIDSAKPTVAMMFGLSIEEDLLSWFSGEIFGANIAETPHFYIGLGTKSADSTWKFFEKFEKVLKIAGAPFDFKDDNFSGVKVKTSAVAGIDKYIKNFLVTLGCTDKYFVIASSKEAFEKIVKSSSDKQSSLSANEEFKKITEWPAGSFLSVYMNFDKFKLSLSDLSANNSPEFSGRVLNKFINTYAMYANCDAKTISGSASIKVMPVKFILDVLEKIGSSAQLREAVESVKGRIK
ncbi:MAG: hypothetical protein A2008_07990 [Candidatus Wallbacteria bacterium GWC2_49_35]|uniref:DUF3352 domain-containing protein n=1 Tax=Candidatus Wallbacteria bacterium GWC2_49_35 TaxID=1817813 RepID=A0A1F7WVW3_9BACT|nr:MAG: hypothetical protein A2008_07990 [Candidatus Wallbacteria bacterium GWC2_49_35]HBC76198.1 hypothetical protein [Candidatus Wallbacteria bacterium]